MQKVGDARIGLVGKTMAYTDVSEHSVRMSGFPSVGKSTLLTKLTGTFSEVRRHICILHCAMELDGIGSRLRIYDTDGRSWHHSLQR